MGNDEFATVALAYGGIENMFDSNAKDKYALALIKYIAEEDKLALILVNQQMFKTPVVRNGKQSTVGYQPDAWNKWEYDRWRSV